MFRGADASPGDMLQFATLVLAGTEQSTTAGTNIEPEHGSYFQARNGYQCQVGKAKGWLDGPVGPVESRGSSAHVGQQMN